MRLDYFYNTEGEHFRFYQIPALLLEEEEYRGISDTAKILYGVLLSRLALSRKNSWIEKDTGRLYITYNLKQLVEKLGRSDRTISKAMKQLSEVGLIEKKKRGQGKPDIIYVMNFTAVHKEGAKEIVPEEQMKQDSRMDKMQGNKREETIAETSVTGKEAKRGDSRSEEITILEKRHAREFYRKKIGHQLEYEILMQRHKTDKNIIDAMIEIMANVYISDRDTYKISGEEIPVNEVQNRIKTLNVQHIEYIIECLNRNTREIRKPDNYLLASLYNAPLTIGLYYKAQVQHDFKMENTVV